MHYRLERPHSPYLVTLVVGEFDEHTEAAGGVKLRTLFPKGRKADAIRCVGRTAEMVRFFEDVTGQQYPWGGYAQVFVSEFIFGGMENTGATTLDRHGAARRAGTPRLQRRAAHLARAGAPVVRRPAHLPRLAPRLAQRGLRHLLRGALEGARRQPRRGRPPARGSTSTLYLSEANERYTRPIVARKFDEPIDLFDRHLYEKGALVLHELRTRLGEADFRKAVRHYVASHRERRGRDGGPRARRRGGHRPQPRPLLRPVRAPRRAPAAEGGGEVGRRGTSGCASPSPSAAGRALRADAADRAGGAGEEDDAPARGDAEGARLPARLGHRAAAGAQSTRAATCSPPSTWTRRRGCGGPSCSTESRRARAPRRRRRWARTARPRSLEALADGAARREGLLGHPRGLRQRAGGGAHPVRQGRRSSRRSG